MYRYIHVYSTRTKIVVGEFKSEYVAKVLSDEAIYLHTYIYIIQVYICICIYIYLCIDIHIYTYILHSKVVVDEFKSEKFIYKYMCTYEYTQIHVYL
jgi:hypothetical protein